ncbi:MAG: RNA polymerase-associated protein RapA, partial [Porticoccaceae bacterium]|nr:RNA polymerase-associated protein RapA [Porticoccaceae bacterium]
VEKLLGDDVVDQLRLSSNLLDELKQYLGEDASHNLMTALDQEHDEGSEAITGAIDQIIRSLLDRHGTGRVLFRNTRDAVAGFPERQYNPHPLPTPKGYANLCAHASVEQRLRPEMLFGDDWLAVDTRVQWLAKWLSGLRSPDGRPEKVLVICARADTAQQLEDYLNLRVGLRSAVFHEGMSLVARDRAAAYFADDEDSAQVLVCSEIGSEGRNFQFSRHLVLFDLPLNPDLLEQRIGRLDRIGQRNSVQIHVPHYDSGAQSVLATWYHQGLNAFERVCPVGAAIYDEMATALHRCLTTSDGVDNLIATTRELAGDALARLQEGRDRLLELSSCNRQRAEQVLAEIAAAECPQILAEYMETVFDKFGIDHSYHSPHAVVINPSDHMHCETFPGLLEDGMTVTFNRTRALSREDMHFLSWEHPMVTGVMDMIVGGDFGNVAICTLKLPPLKPGTLLLESFFTLHCPAPKSLQLYRFLPMTRSRVVVDANGKDLSAVLATEHFDRLGQKIAKPTAEAVVRHARPQISAMIKQAEALALSKSRDGDEGDLIARAVAAMEKQLGQEHQRLNALARVNANIRQDEIDHISQSMSALKAAMARAEWRMDSLRIAITT